MHTLIVAVVFAGKLQPLHRQLRHQDARILSPRGARPTGRSMERGVIHYCN